MVALITAATVVIVGVEQGIIVAIVLSLILVLMHVYKPHDRVIAIAPDGTRTLGPVDQPVQAAPGLVIYAFGAELFYANATRFTEEVMSLVEGADPPLRWFVLDAAAMGDIDYSGADTLRQIRDELDGRGTQDGPVLRRPGRPEAARRLRADREDRRGEHLRDVAGRPRRVSHDG